jgi:hypothetical protein
MAELRTQIERYAAQAHASTAGVPPGAGGAAGSGGGSPGP